MGNRKLSWQRSPRRAGRVNRQKHQGLTSPPRRRGAPIGQQRRTVLAAGIIQELLLNAGCIIQVGFSVLELATRWKQASRLALDVRWQDVHSQPPRFGAAAATVD